MITQDLTAVAQELVAPGRGILAADESTSTISRRFEQVGIRSDAESRRRYRELLFTAPGIEAIISGVILYEETFHQHAADGTLLPALLESRGIVPGIKVDAGTSELPLHPGEVVTEGLDGLGVRLAGYAEAGARFTKWRAVIRIGDGLPSVACIHANAHALARYAAHAQAAGLVPIVEPEVLLEGTHDLARCEAVTTRTLEMVFSELLGQDVDPAAMLLKPNMVLPGKDGDQAVDDQAIAEATLRCLRATVPDRVPGIVFLSGGQTPEQAMARLNAIRRQAGDAAPWTLSFSFARALQGPPLEYWGQHPDDTEGMQQLFAHRCRCAQAAAKGVYDPAMEEELR